MTSVDHGGPFIFNAAADVIQPNGGTLYFNISNPNPARFNDCTVTATAHGLAGLVSGPQFLEVVQTATRGGPSNARSLDIVVRNNGPRYCPHTTVWVGMIRP
jgi:hypothetical protein